MVKNPPANAGDISDLGSIPGSGRSPGEGKWQPIPVFLPGKSLGHRTLMGYSPLSCKRDRQDLAIKQQEHVKWLVCVTVCLCVCVCPELSPTLSSLALAGGFFITAHNLGMYRDAWYPTNVIYQYYKQQTQLSQYFFFNERIKTSLSANGLILPNKFNGSLLYHKHILK